jgi:nickel transport protein
MSIMIVAGISSRALAHGLGYRIVEKKTVPVVMFYYSGGKSVSYAEVKVWSPTNDSIEFQNGRTDENGIFAFNPDSEGIWRIEVNDGLGHKVTAEYEMYSSPEQTLKSSNGQHSKFLFAGLGISLIFNVAGIVRVSSIINKWRFNSPPNKKSK